MRFLEKKNIHFDTLSYLQHHLHMLEDRFHHNKAHYLINHKWYLQLEKLSLKAQRPHSSIFLYFSEKLSRDTSCEPFQSQANLVADILFFTYFSEKIS